MTYEEWRESYHPSPLMNEAMARAAWDAATSVERAACAKIADAELNPYPQETSVSQYQSGIFTAAEHIAAAIRARRTL